MNQEQVVKIGLRSLEKTPEGRAVLLWLLSITDPLAQIPTDNLNQVALGIVLGQQAVGKTILTALFELDPEMYGRLIKEMRNA